VAAKTTEVVTTSDENTNVTVVDTKTNNNQVNSNTLVKNDTENITTVTKEPEVKTNITPNKTTTTTKSWVTYKVQKGDTLWKIANKHGVTVDDVKNNNNISGDKIIIGQVLKIKSK
jgi:LysM repeat protein